MKRSPKPRRVQFQMGSTQVTKIGAARMGWTDTYHFVLGLSWPRFLALIVALFLGINLAFATAYYLLPDSIGNARPGVFADRFFFSADTFSTVGYGNMYPATLAGHALATVEMLVGLISVATVTGLVFARFSAPRARILFSDVMVVAPFNGVPTLMLRAANERHNLILEATVKVTLNRRETTVEGESFRHLIDLPLVRERTPAFSLSWTVMHPIDENSPFHGHTLEQLCEEGAVLTVSLTGMDEVLNDTVHARTDYHARQIRFGHRFVDVLERDGDSLVVDFTRFHDTQPVQAAQ